MTRWKPDLGSLAHFAFGIVAVALDVLWLFSLIFLFLQASDLIWERESPSETELDTAEYAAGVIAGLVVRGLL